MMNLTVSMSRPWVAGDAVSSVAGFGVSKAACNRQGHGASADFLCLWCMREHSAAALKPILPLHLPSRCTPLAFGGRSHCPAHSAGQSRSPAFYNSSRRVDANVSQGKLEVRILQHVHTDTII